MRIVKIVVGILLLWGIASEYVNASRELVTWFSPWIIISALSMLLICAWLFGTALTHSKYKISKTQFIKYYAIITIVFIPLVFLRASINLPSHFVEVGSKKIPLGQCIQGSVRMIKNPEDREIYCQCLADKLSNDTVLKIKYQKRLEKGELLQVLQELKDNEQYLDMKFEECMSSVKMTWTDVMARSAKAELKASLVGSEFEQTNNLDLYCDCLIEEYRKYPFDSIQSETFMVSETAIDIDNRCTQISTK